MEGHSAPHNDTVAGPIHTKPWEIKHKSGSGAPNSNCLLMKSIAKPAGGFSLGHTSQRLVEGNSIVSPLNNAKTASATTSERGGQPGIIKSISITSPIGLTLLSR